MHTLLSRALFLSLVSLWTSTQAFAGPAVDPCAEAYRKVNQCFEKNCRGRGGGWYDGCTPDPKRCEGQLIGRGCWCGGQRMFPNYMCKNGQVVPIPEDDPRYDDFKKCYSLFPDEEKCPLPDCWKDRGHVTPLCDSMDLELAMPERNTGPSKGDAVPY